MLEAKVGAKMRSEALQAALSLACGWTSVAVRVGTGVKGVCKGGAGNGRLD